MVVEVKKMNEDFLKILDLLERKNTYLLEFHKLNNKEISLLSKGKVQNLENFYYSREILLNAIDKLELKFENKSIYEGCEMDFKEKKKLSDILKLKNDMIRSILDQDMLILSLVDQLNEEASSVAS